MPLPSRLLLVDDVTAEWQLALAGFADSGFMDQVTAVKNRDEALDFLHARGAFRRRSEGLPDVVVLGPNLQGAAAMALLKEIRADESTQRLPVVVVAPRTDADIVRAAYRHGANSVIRRDDDATVQQGRYKMLALFWAGANEPPPGGFARTPAAGAPS